jgi:acetoin:2,6-dichlorophenolindophenol oxidoreductase subunit alpha
VDAVRASVAEAVGRARRGEGPSLIEARTWRARGHWAADPQDYRSAHVEQAVVDPLELQAASLIERGEASGADIQLLVNSARSLVTATLERVAAWPDVGENELGLDEVLV